MINTNIRINGADLGHIGWKYYNSIKKKAMEQEFSWAGLGLSLSIAFFVVILSAEGLSLAYKSLPSINKTENIGKTRIYMLESFDFVNKTEKARLSDGLDGVYSKNC